MRVTRDDTHDLAMPTQYRSERRAAFDESVTRRAAHSIAFGDALTLGRVLSVVLILTGIVGLKLTTGNAP